MKIMPAKSHRTNSRKEAMLQALNKTRGIVSPACEVVGINRCTHYEWMQEDPKYKKAVEDIQEVKIDFMETALSQRIEKGDTAAIIFGLKCLGKNRGFFEKQVNENRDMLDPSQPIKIVFGSD